MNPKDLKKLIRYTVKEVIDNTSTNSVSSNGRNSEIAHAEEDSNRAENVFRIKRLTDELDIKQKELVFRQKEIHSLHVEISDLQDELNFLTHRK